MRRLLLAATVLLFTTSCGEPAQLTGYTRDPAPDVGELSLPELTNDGAERQFVADPGELLLVYFGFTNCPDVCPTTLADLRAALQQSDDDIVDRITLAMITVDPGRDLDVLPVYVQSFVPDSIALGTDDADRLARVAQPFGASYSVTTNDDGDIEVAHSASTYAIDDTGHIVLTWQFGVSADDFAKDFELLLEDE